MLKRISRWILRKELEELEEELYHYKINYQNTHRELWTVCNSPDGKRAKEIVDRERFIRTTADQWGQRTLVHDSKSRAKKTKSELIHTSTPLSQLFRMLLGDHVSFTTIKQKGKNEL